MYNRVLRFALDNLVYSIGYRGLVNNLYFLVLFSSQHTIRLYHSSLED
jgi:hypothetical protein